MWKACGRNTQKFARQNQGSVPLLQMFYINNEVAIYMKSQNKLSAELLTWLPVLVFLITVLLVLVFVINNYMLKQ
jgi:hypothetical protein